MHLLMLGVWHICHLTWVPSSLKQVPWICVMECCWLRVYDFVVGRFGMHEAGLITNYLCRHIFNYIGSPQLRFEGESTQ